MLMKVKAEAFHGRQFHKNAVCSKNIKLIIEVCQKVGYNLINKNAVDGKNIKWRVLYGNKQNCLP